MPWNPEKYHQFQTQRSAPFYDLLKLVEVRPNLKVVDLGCGTGQLTRHLADSLPNSEVLGLDASPQMLEHTVDHTRSGLRFMQGDQAELDGTWDLIFSNAALQWSVNHEMLFQHIFKLLNTGGQIAVQMPSNHNSTTHLIINKIAGREPFVSALGGWTRKVPVLSIEEYAGLLFRVDAEDIHVFEKVYPHVLKNANAIVEWISGTALLPYFERLGNLRDEFVDAIRQELQVIMPEEPVFYPFRRTFISARKADYNG